MPQELFHCNSCKGRKRVDQHGKPSLMKGPTTKVCPLCNGVGYLRYEPEKEKSLIKENVIAEVKLEENVFENIFDDSRETEPPKIIKRRGRPPKK